MYKRQAKYNIIVLQKFDYHLNNIIDEEEQKEIYDYFLEDAETDNIKDAYDEFEGDYSEEELRLMKIKFMSEMAN